MAHTSSLYIALVDYGVAGAIALVTVITSILSVLGGFVTLIAVWREYKRAV